MPNTTRSRSRSGPRATASAPTSTAAPRSRSRSTATTVQLPRLLTADEVADLLRTTRKAIYCQIQRGALPGVIRLQRRVLIDGSVMAQWLDSKRELSRITEGDQR